MNIKNVRTENIIPYENNPRNNEQAVDYVANSIQEFGFKVPIIIDKENVVIAGHTRLLAAKKLGLEEVPTIVADDLNEDQIRAFRLADNKVSEISGWNYPLLEVELEEINLDMKQFGFEEVDLSDIDDFFSDAPEKEKDQEKADFIICPHCGEKIEVEK